MTTHKLKCINAGECDPHLRTGAEYEVESDSGYDDMWRVIGAPPGFAWFKSRFETPEQAAERRATEGVAKAAGSAAWIESFVANLMRGFFYSGARTVEKAMESTASKLPEGKDGRALGAVTRYMLKHKLIRPSGTFGRAVSSNGSLKPEYIKA